MAVKITVMPLDIDPSAKPITHVFNKDELTLGRLPSNDIVLNRPEVSGIHARLRVETNGSLATSKLFITDLGSSNGTMVEKSPLSPRTESSMTPSDRIFIGNFVIKPTLVEGEPLEDPHTSSDMALDESHPTQQMRRSVLEDAIGDEASLIASPGMDSDKDADIDAFAKSRAGNISGVAGVEESSHVDESSKQRDFLHSLIGEKAEQNEASDSQSDSAQIEAPSNGNGNGSHSGSPFGHTPTYSQSQSTEVSADEQDVAKETSHTNKTIQGTSTVETNTSSSERATPRDLSSAAIDELSFKIVVDGSNLDSFDITASAYSDIAGAIIHKGKPLSGVTVVSSELGTTTTGEDGRFVFPKVLEGTEYSIQLRKPKFSFEPPELRGSADMNVSELSVNATELFTIRGVISHKGKPLPGVAVDGGELGVVNTGPDGEYVFENVPEGTEFDLKVSKSGFAFAR